jgi:hypothetical protein
MKFSTTQSYILLAFAVYSFVRMMIVFTLTPHIIDGSIYDIADVVLIATPYGFVIDPDHYCPRNPSIQKPVVRLRDGEIVLIDGESCNNAREILSHARGACDVGDIRALLKDIPATEQASFLRNLEIVMVDACKSDIVVPNKLRNRIMDR